MLTRSELPENPVVLAIRDDDGRKHMVTAERVRGGKVRMTCTCDASRSQGWCRHQVQLLCMRYDDVINRSEEAEFHFEDLVMGTALADTADEVDVALVDYDEALTAMNDKRPKGIESDKLAMIADLADNLADAAIQLNAAIGRFKKRLASEQPQIPRTRKHLRVA